MQQTFLSNEKGFLDRVHWNNVTLLSTKISTNADFESNREQLEDSKCDKRDEPISSRIPRLAHFIWIGNRPLPEYGHRCIKQFHSLHPSWTVMLWSNREISSDPELSNLIKDIFNEGKASDLLRYAILARLGGVYIDVDYEFTGCLEAIPGIFDSDRGSPVKFFCGLSNTSMVEVNNGILGCTSGHPLMKEILHLVQQTHQRSMSMAKGIISFLPPAERRSTLVALQIESPESILLQSGPLMLTSFIDRLFAKYSLEQVCLQFGLMILPPQVFHPVPNLAKVTNLAGYLNPSEPGKNNDDDDAMLPYDCFPSSEVYQVLIQLMENRDSYELISRHMRNMSSTGIIIDWTNYTQLKELFAGTNISISPAIAIHWWQRSWQ